MAVPFALMAAGTALQIAGQYGANLAQAKQEMLNARFYQEQADYARLSSERAGRLASLEYTSKLGQQVGAYAASGVDSGSGSAAITVGGTIASALDELFAIKKKGDLDVKLAQLRSVNSQNTADTLKSPGFNLMQGATTLIGNYTKSEGFGTWGNAGNANSVPKYSISGGGVNNPSNYSLTSGGGGGWQSRASLGVNY